jgi:SRSO17 transposase
MTLSAWAGTLPPNAWHVIRWHEGSRGPQESRFAACCVQPAHRQTRNRDAREPLWGLVEWSPGSEAASPYWFSNLPEEVSLRRLVQLAKLRGGLEQSYQQWKEELGLDHYEGRGWQGWHHHVTLVGLAYAFLL